MVWLEEETVNSSDCKMMKMIFADGVIGRRDSEFVRFRDDEDDIRRWCGWSRRD